MLSLTISSLSTTSLADWALGVYILEGPNNQETTQRVSNPVHTTGVPDDQGISVHALGSPDHHEDPWWPTHPPTVGPVWKLEGQEWFIYYREERWRVGDKTDNGRLRSEETGIEKIPETSWQYFSSNSSSGTGKEIPELPLETSRLRWWISAAGVTVKGKQHCCLETLKLCVLGSSFETNPCYPNPCGLYSQHKEHNGSCVCSCEIASIGAPPNCRPECMVSSACSQTTACIQQQCRDPCHGDWCGTNAECEVINHNPTCTCSKGYHEDPVSAVCTILSKTIFMHCWKTI